MFRKEIENLKKENQELRNKIQELEREIKNLRMTMNLPKRMEDMVKSVKKEKNGLWKTSNREEVYFGIKKFPQKKDRDWEYLIYLSLYKNPSQDHIYNVLEDNLFKHLKNITDNTFPGVIKLHYDTNIHQVFKGIFDNEREAVGWIEDILGFKYSPELNKYLV